MPEMETRLGDGDIISQLWGKGKGEPPPGEQQMAVEDEGWRMEDVGWEYMTNYLLHNPLVV
jgi:hypothetical protein